MNLLLDVVGVLLWLGLTALCLFGVGLAVATADALLDGRGVSPDPAARQVTAGRWLAIRRYAAWWTIGVAAWLATAFALAVARGL